MAKRWMGMLAALALVSGGVAVAGGQGSAAKQQTGVGSEGQEEAASQSGILLDEQSGVGGSGDSDAPPEARDEAGMGGSGQAGQTDKDMRQGSPGDAKATTTGEAKQKDHAHGDAKHDKKHGHKHGQLAAQSELQPAGGEITGKVVKTEGKMVFVDHMGVVVPLRVDAKTRFEDPSLKRAKDLALGQEIRAQVTVKNRTQNVAQSIALAGGVGGAGQQDLGGDAGKGGSGLEDGGVGGSGEGDRKGQDPQRPWQDNPSDVPTPDSVGDEAGKGTLDDYR